MGTVRAVDRIGIIGAGPAGLAAAETLDRAGSGRTVFSEFEAHGNPRHE